MNHAYFDEYVLKQEYKAWKGTRNSFTLYLKVLLNTCFMQTLIKRSIRTWLIFFILSLLFSGVTAFAVETELKWVLSWWPFKEGMLYQWLMTCYDAIQTTNAQYPYIAYGYDWLAFAHIVLAIVFIGPYKDPVRNKWVIQFGCIACVMIIPLAFIAGAVRHIPIFWRLIDCSFGIVGIIPLWICYRKINQLEQQSRPHYQF